MTTSDVIIVLCRPSEAGNMGAVCRVMKNMDFSRLYIVAPHNMDDDVSRARAVHAADIWDNASIFSTLEEALSGCSFAAGITRRRGVSRKSSTMSARDLACFLRDRGAPCKPDSEGGAPAIEPDAAASGGVAHNGAAGGLGGVAHNGAAGGLGGAAGGCGGVAHNGAAGGLGGVAGGCGGGRDTAALVFGNERTGLESAELALCDIASHIPVSGVFPSLNLSHAVQIYCYELFVALSGGDYMPAAVPEGCWEPLPRHELVAECKNVYAALKKIGFYEHKENEEQLIFFRDILARAGITRREAGYLRNIILKAARLSGNGE